MAFDGITTKAISYELQNLSGARIDKVYQPNKNEIIIGLYINGSNYALNISIDSQNYRINLTTHPKANPQVAPNFCMLLRKHLIGLKLKNVITSNLERLVILEVEGFDDLDEIVSKKLIIELMGKHGNIILVDEANCIIDCMRHIKSDDDVNRSVLPHLKYVFPTTTKKNFFDLKNYEDFKNSLPLDLNLSNVALEISNTFNGISKIFVENILDTIDSSNFDEVLHYIYDYLYNVIINFNSDKLCFETIERVQNSRRKKDYFLKPFLENSSVKNSESNENFSLNFFIDEFYYTKETSEKFKNYRDTTLKLILGILKKYQTRLVNIDKKLAECKDMDKYKLYGELITANLYRIENRNMDSVSLENYYDNNNLIEIPLDKRYVPSVNAKRFFKKYNKLKNTLEIVGVQKEETVRELDYLQSIVYELEASSSVEDVAQIFDEISENVLIQNDMKLKQKSSKIKKSKFTKNKEVSFNPIKYAFEGFTILVGRNNKENDYLTMKFASKSDLWFHTKFIHGSHVILKCDGSKDFPSDSVLYKCAELARDHSKGKNSSNVPVDFCLVKYVKKPNGAKPGMVIYSNNKTLYVK